MTWDSCRYDAYLEARTPALDQFGEPRRAWAMATYTLPAHEAMFYGFLPHVFAPEPLYNRYSQQVWRISHRNVDAKPLVTFPLGQGNIVNGFRRRGYATLGTAAMDWFRDAPELRQGFENFEVSGVGAATEPMAGAPVGKAGEETALLRLRQLRRDPQPLPLRGHGDRRSRSRAAIRPAAALQSAGPLDRAMGVRPSGLPPAGRRRLLSRRADRRTDRVVPPPRPPHHGHRLQRPRRVFRRERPVRARLLSPVRDGGADADLPPQRPGPRRA